MNAFEFYLAFYGLLLGLSVAEVASGFLNAIDARRKVKLGWLTPSLAIFVFFGALIPVGICAAMHLGLRGWRRTLRDVPVGIVGFAIGIAPLVVINGLTSARGLGFLGAKFGQAGGAPRSEASSMRRWKFSSRSSL